MDLFLLPSTFIRVGVLFNTLALSTGEGTVVGEDTAQRARSMLLATILSMVVTDGLARINGKGEWPMSASLFVQPRNPSPNQSLTSPFLQSGLLQGQKVTL